MHWHHQPWPRTCSEKMKKDKEGIEWNHSHTSRGALPTGLLRSPLGRGMPADGPFFFFIGLRSRKR